MRKSLVMFLLAMMPSIHINAWVDTDLDGVPDKKDACNDTPKQSVVMANGCTDPDTIKPLSNNEKNIGVSNSVINDGIASAELESICRDASEILENDQLASACILQRLQPIYFEFAKADIVLSQLPMLDVINEIKQTDPNVYVSLIGHADIIGSDDINQALSLARAEEVKSLLIKRFNFKPENISVKGMSNAQPAADNSTIEGRQRNRRVEFIISAE
ncbi:OmpA family protein [Shewanella gaetbuli]